MSQATDLRTWMKRAATTVHRRASAESSRGWAQLRSALEGARANPREAAKQAVLIAAVVAGSVALVPRDYYREDEPLPDHTQYVDEVLLSRQESRKGMHERLLGAISRQQQAQVHILDADLARMFREMEETSPTFKREMEEVRKSGFRLWIGTHQQVGIERDDREAGAVYLVDHMTARDTAQAVLFVINLPLIQERYAGVAEHLSYEIRVNGFCLGR
jgi:hypothetical protein